MLWQRVTGPSGGFKLNIDQKKKRTTNLENTVISTTPVTVKHTLYEKESDLLPDC